MEWFWIFLLISHGSLFIIFYCLQRCLKKHIRQQLEQNDRRGSVSIFESLRRFVLISGFPFKSAVVVNVLAPRTEATTIEFSDCPPKYEDLEKNLVAVISTKNNNLPPSYEEALNKIEVNWECIWVIMMHWWHDGFYIKYNDGLTAKRETKRF